MPSSFKVLALAEELNGRGAHVPQEMSASVSGTAAVTGVVEGTKGSSSTSPSRNDYFEAASTFQGQKPGWVFGTSEHGTGYYRDDGASSYQKAAAAATLVQSEYYEISFRPGDGESLGLEVNVPASSASSDGSSSSHHGGAQANEGAEPTLSKSRLLRGAKGLPVVEAIDNPARVAQYGVCVGDVVVAANGTSLLPAHANRGGLSGPTCSLGMRADPALNGASGDCEEGSSMNVLAGIVVNARDNNLPVTLRFLRASVSCDDVLHSSRKQKGGGGGARADGSCLGAADALGKDGGPPSSGASKEQLDQLMAQVAQGSAALLKGLSADEKAKFATLLGFGEEDGPEALDKMAKDMAEIGTQATSTTQAATKKGGASMDSAGDGTISETPVRATGERNSSSSDISSGLAAAMGSSQSGYASSSSSSPAEVHQQQSLADANAFVNSLANSDALKSMAAMTLLDTPTSLTQPKSAESAPAPKDSQTLTSTTTFANSAPTATITPAPPPVPPVPPEDTNKGKPGYLVGEPSVYALNPSWLDDQELSSNSVPTRNEYLNYGNGLLNESTPSSATSILDTMAATPSRSDMVPSRDRLDMKSLVAQAQRENCTTQQQHITGAIGVGREAGGSEKAVAAPAWTAQALDEPEALLRQQFAELAAQRNAIVAGSSKAKAKSKGAGAKSGTKSTTSTAKIKQPAIEAEKKAALSAWEALRQEEDLKRQVFVERAAATAAAAAAASGENDASKGGSSSSTSGRGSAGSEPAESTKCNRKKPTAETLSSDSTTTAVAAAAWASLAKEETHRTKQFKKKVSKLAPPDASPPL